MPLEQFDVIEPEDEKPKRKPKGKPKRRPLYIPREIQLGVLVGLAGIVVGLLLMSQPARPGTVLPTLAPLPTGRPPMTTVLETPAAGPTTIAEHIYNLTWSPDGKTMAVITSQGGRLYNADYLMQSPTLLTGYTGLPTRAAFSPDGKSVAALSVLYGSRSDQASGHITVWELSPSSAAYQPPGIALRGTFDTGDGYLDSLDWSPDGKAVVAAGRMSRVAVWDLGTDRRNLLETGMSGVNSIWFTGDNALLGMGYISHEDASKGYWAEGYALQWAQLGNGAAPATQLRMKDDQFGLADANDLSRLNGGAQAIVNHLLEQAAGVKSAFPGWLPGRIEPRLNDLSPGGQWVAIAYGEYARHNSWEYTFVGVWRRGDLNALWTTEYAGRVNALAFRPDGAALAIGTDDGLVELRDTISGSVVSALRI